jgi:hypothetical protein
MVPCISAAGESLTPYMIALQDSASVGEEVKKHGVPFGSGSISSWSRRVSLISTRKSFLITSGLYFYLISLNSWLWMNLLKRPEYYWRVITRVMWSCDPSPHRGTSAHHNFCTTRNSDLSSSWCDSLWCSHVPSSCELPFEDWKETVQLMMKAS